MSERVEECRRDLANLKRFADEIDRTLDAVDATSGHNVWKGPAADNFREEWGRKRKKLHDTLEAARGQRAKILRRVQEEEEKKKGEPK
ncbi:hypothetical protein DCW30_30025 [Streptomyces alfalfae]|uniref:WXG100 family type VII secretion target n=1 Tax=Streptomyces alfalfae TaxID=1642299 RepID=A0ABN4VH67_9ACTN|nr:hypothetical protein [Streptomyces alfalfae]APY86971.1 hypothetical protein A7J05_15605 [Streptomyces alfalfae]AYA17361.1 hypothetical protein D3X13_14890 [Streptomyces fradiae]RXX37131.1 hypothetical protein DCW30_30025 [Streptomyces alfalfae]RZM87385.1 hypothetical protein D4104_27710 [Streptomyces alfalfae]